MREKILICNDWLFSHEFSEKMIEAAYDEASMESVRLPHNAVDLAYNYVNEDDYQEVSGYRYHLFAKKEWEGKAVNITFEGAAHEATLYVNGKKLLTHSTGYTAFTVDISDEIVYGADNIIALSVDSRETLNTPPFGKVIDYMTYSGLYREAYLEITEKIHIKDLYVMPSDVRKDSSKLNVRIEMAGIEAGAEELKYRIRLSRHIIGGTVKAAAEFIDENIPDNRISGVIDGALTERVYTVSKVNLWSVENPNLYDVSVAIYKENKLIDEKVVRTGFRRAEFKKDGFYLNGRKFLIRGMDRHQCYPYVGYAMPASMQINDADIMKNELSLNAVRTSHYPQSHHFLDRCDEIGLLVFTEMPGWQHIGDDAWKDQAVENVKEMITQYRNHTSIILWGVRINESQDDNEFYTRTNAVAHELDPFRPTGGVRNFAKSNLLEDVYTYNDFSHTGNNTGCEPKGNVTPDTEKPYLISEYNGHMFPTKAFDCEEHRLEHALRHANVINSVAAYDNISGSFGWCMFDYNTHKDFGSGDRICYHGIMDMYRNPKLAAAVYESQKDPKKGVVLHISSSMDIGEHPAGNLGSVYAFTNADSVKVYKNDEFIREYTKKETEHTSLAHGPIVIDDFIGDQLETKEGFSKKKADMVKGLLLDFAKYGMAGLPAKSKLNAARLMTFYKMTYDDGVNLFGKYVGNWGGHVTTYRFDAIYNGEVVKSVTKAPVTNVHLDVKADHTELHEGYVYDVAAIRITAKDEFDNLMNYYQEAVSLLAEGDIEIIGPKLISLKGGMGGTYIKTTGRTGRGKLYIVAAGLKTVVVDFEVN